MTRHAASPRDTAGTRDTARSRDAVRSREAIFAAAAAEFAAAGFAGASVDRIAERAGLNKAMLYYHFADKEALYREIICDIFRCLADRLDHIAASPADPADRIDAAIDGIATMAGARPHFPAMMAREIAEGGVHLDEAMLGAMTRVFRGFIALLVGGDAPRQFRPFNPGLMYFTIIAPLVFFMASTPVRARLKRHLADGPGPLARLAAGIPDDLASMLAHHKRAVRLMLTASPPLGAVAERAPAAPPGARPAAPRRAASQSRKPAAATRPRRRRSVTPTRPGESE